MSSFWATFTAAARYRCFALARRVIPRRWHERFGRSRLLRPWRDALIRPGGVATVTGGPVSLDGLQFHFEAPFHVYHQAATRGIETLLARYVKTWAEDGWTCVDVGSHCGYLTVIMALSVGPRGRVVACEARPATLATLRRNLAANAVEARTRVVEGWVGAIDGDADGVGRLRLDSALDRLAVDHVDLVKIDVDGGDLDVLHGAEVMLRRDRPVVIIELAANEQAIYDWLGRLGYRHRVGMRLEPVDPAAEGFAGWPPNLIASVEPLPGIPSPSRSGDRE